jgi:hypothetical protein
MRRSVLRWANNYQLSPTTSLATYLPLRKNIIFHKLIASPDSGTSWCTL